jgi:hypothetical protein
MLNNSITIAPNAQWKLADYYMKPSKSSQVSTGIFRTFEQGIWETSCELFYKTTANFTEFKDGADFLNTPNLETQVLQGNQKAYGMEIFIKRSRKKLEGWISYTYSRSIVQINGNNTWEKINNGNAYPSNYDIPNVLNVLATYHFNRRVTVSSDITYQTGKPVTYPTSIYYINGNQYMDYSARNEYRIPDYFRIDASVTIEGNLKRYKSIHSSWMLSVYNLTGRANANSVFFKTDSGGTVKSYKYSVIGVPFFSITWVFKLGNYASE